MVSMFVFNKSMYIMQRILCTSTCALRGVVWQKLASWYNRSNNVGLLYMYFVCNVFRTC